MIADDLTGACDAAVQFTGSGRRVKVALQLDGELPPSDILAVSTESRGLSADDSRRAVIEMALRLVGSQPQILFKKIDSMLRGNAGSEIAAATEAFNCDAAVITPAFPAMKRIVENGWLMVDGPAAFQPIELGAYLAAQGLAPHRHVPADAAAAILQTGVRFLSADANCDHHLDALVDAVLYCGHRVMWAGSGGLAAALARRMAPATLSNKGIAHPMPVLLCIGSTHAATTTQLRRLIAERSVCALSAVTANADEILEALRAGRNVVLEVPRGQIAEERIADLLHRTIELPVALALSGGDTTSHICRALHACSIELHSEIEAGIPWGTLQGGMLEGVAVATKSGAFGDSGALIAIADFFTCPKA